MATMSVAQESFPFVLPQLRVDSLDISLAEPRYLVTLLGQGRQLMISPKVADLINQLQEGISLEEAARALSGMWERAVSADDLRYIIEHQMVAQGLAYPADEVPAAMLQSPKELAAQLVEAAKIPLYEKLLKGQFQWRLMKRDRVEKLCSPLAVAYQPLSLLLALVLIVATRWMLYSTFESYFVRQVMTQSTPTEYLASLAILIVVVMIHEFGHAAAQLRYGLPAGAIGFHLYHYLPTFFANASASWKLKPSRRVVVDMGGIYFQAIIASILYLIYLKTQYLPLMITVLTSDTLCLIALNPFLRFDGYWVLVDLLGVPNLQKRSTALLGRYWKRMRGQPAMPDAFPISGWRAVVISFYSILKNCFWVVLVVVIVMKAGALYATAAATISKFVSMTFEGFKTANPALVAASLIRLLLFVLLILTLSSLVANMAVKLWQLARRAVTNLWLRRKANKIIGPARG
jgi:putative peptide zinc metalloprotease protein